MRNTLVYLLFTIPSLAVSQGDVATQDKDPVCNFDFHCLKSKISDCDTNTYLYPPRVIYTFKNGNVKMDGGLIGYYTERYFGITKLNYYSKKGVIIREVISIDFFKSWSFKIYTNYYMNGQIRSVKHFLRHRVTGKEEIGQSEFYNRKGEWQKSKKFDNDIEKLINSSKELPQ